MDGAQPRGRRTSPILIGGSAVLVLSVACSLHQTVSAVGPQDRVVLERAPLWNAAAVWDENEEHLIVLDPEAHELLVVSLDGRIGRRVELDPLAGLDYTTPLRLLSTEEGYVLGDRHRLVRFDRHLEPLEVVDLFARLGESGIAGGSLSDFVIARDTLYGYADFRRAGESDRDWHRGFVRVELGTGRLALLSELALADGEFARYYYYDRRPYVTVTDGRIYVLRYGDPPTLHRARRGSLARGTEFETGGMEALSILGWRGRLFVLLAPAETDPLGPTGGDWLLRAVDPGSGAVVEDFPLPSDGRRLHVVPGERRWAILEQPADVGAEKTRRISTVRFEPAARFRLD